MSTLLILKNQLKKNIVQWRERYQFTQESPCLENHYYGLKMKCTLLVHVWEAWFPISGTALGGAGNFRRWSLESTPLGVVLVTFSYPVHLSHLSSLSLSLSLWPPTLCHSTLLLSWCSLYLTVKELKTLKPWAKINLLSFQVVFSDTLPQWCKTD
jgi:hypothetical protein